MRAIHVFGALALGALALAPTAGASCHYCFDPVVDYLRQLLP